MKREGSFNISLQRFKWNAIKGMLDLDSFMKKFFYETENLFMAKHFWAQHKI